MNCLVSKPEMDGMFSKLRGKGIDVPLTLVADNDNKDKKEEDGNAKKADEEAEKADEEGKE